MDAADAQRHPPLTRQQVEVGAELSRFARDSSVNLCVRGFRSGLDDPGAVRSPQPRRLGGNKPAHPRRVFA